MALRIEITVQAEPGLPDCKRCVKNPNQENRPAFGNTCWTCGVSNERKLRPARCRPGCRGECQVKAPKFELAPELAVKVHLFRMVARKLHRAQGHRPNFLECCWEDCGLWRAIENNARPLK